MAEFTIYLKPTCSTCREAVRLVRESGQPFTAINYYEQPFTKSQYHNELEQVTNSMSTFVSAMKTKMEINLILKVLTMVRPEWYPDSLYGIKIKNVISRNPLSQEHSPVKPVVFSPVLHFQKSTEETKKIIKKVGELRITRCKPEVKVK